VLPRKVKIMVPMNSHSRDTTKVLLVTACKWWKQTHWPCQRWTASINHDLISDDSNHALSA
jgi:hypothetical protein